MSALVSGGVSALAGRLRVVPGAPPPLGLQSSRRNWAAQLAVGRPAAALPGLMASVFNLCSQAHRLCAHLALDAAQPGVLGALPPHALAQRLRTETAREHIRRIGLDWPRWLGNAAPAGAAPAHAALQGSALLGAHGPADPWADTCHWLQREWLHMPATTWLAAWQAGGVAWLREWAGTSPAWLAQLLHGAHDADLTTHAGDLPPLHHANALRVHADAASLHALSAMMFAQPGFVLNPHWQGACAHTGSWARLHSPAASLPSTPWALLGCRVAELVRLCLPDDGPAQGTGVLSAGALPTGEHQGLAWVEMARGLLVYRVALHAAGATATVSACNVLAPTEWNFHPSGVVAQHIARLPAGEPPAVVERRVGLLMAAFDPCVPFDVVHPHPTTEVIHA